MAAGDLVTWAQVKSVLTLEDEKQELVEFLISASTAHAEKIAGRFLAARGVSIKMDARGGRELLLPGYPVNSVSRICIDSDHLFPVSNDLTQDKYSLKTSAGIIRLFNHRFPHGYDVVLFDGNIGYDPVPNDLQQAVIETISANIRRFGNIGGLVGIKQMSAGADLTTQYEIDLPLTARSVFNSYRGARI